MADTDKGWFTWEQAPVESKPVSLTLTSSSDDVSFPEAVSQELRVSFPIAVEVRRAWITVAKATGDGKFGWEKQGMVQCDPPDLSERRLPMETLPKSSDPVRAPSPPLAAVAVATAAPISDTPCDEPFAPVKVTHAQAPDVPDSYVARGNTKSATTTIEVAIDAGGNFVDAWVLISSGFPELDQAAIDAARRSKY